MQASFRSTKGFTLVELMIVVAVIAIVGAIAIPSVLNARKPSNETWSRSARRASRSALTRKAGARDSSLVPTRIALLPGER